MFDRGVRFVNWLGRAFAAIALFWAVVQLLASCAPTISHPRPVSAAEFSAACGWYGPALSAVAYAQSGGLTLYHVVCSREDLPMDVAR